ncbi:MAG: PKD domain-containing protein [Cyclobacteriaceae bacterium]|nr:PKD domain-containing protein [Cyclobacteriaceae bacterium]
MRFTKNYLLTGIACIFCCFTASAQDNTPTGPEITMDQDKRYENVYTFEVINEPILDQMAGAPEAFYDYFWEFGDGSFSLEEKPTHTYKDFGNGDVLVALTNNYSNGGAPPTRPKKKRKTKDRPPPPENTLAANWKEGGEINSTLEAGQSLGIMTNHSPRPGDPIVAVLSYKNNGLSGISPGLPQEGRVYLFYNEKSYDYDNFTFQSSRQHAGEVLTQGFPPEDLAWNYPGFQESVWTSNASLGPIAISKEVNMANEHKDILLRDAKKKYHNVLTWDFNDLQKDEVRNIFSTFVTTPEMLRDTSATINFQAIMVPHNSVTAESYTLALTVQASHDPNKMYVSERFINKKDMRTEGLVYTIKFQNIGRGPASNIMIENQIHPSLDPSTLKIIDHYPQTLWCDWVDSLGISSCHDTLVSKGLITWKFNNIYLPGRRQQDKEGKKATKGWIKYSIRPYSRIKGRNFRGRAHIYFDRNEPIATNQVRTKVDKSRSVGFKAGLHDVENDFEHLFGGIVWAPFRPKGFYHQGELMVSEEGYLFAETLTDVPLGTDAAGNTLFGNLHSEYDYSLLFVDFVPLQIRKNLLRTISVGIGAQLSLLVRADEHVNVQRVFNQPGPPEENEVLSTRVVDLLDGVDDDRFNVVEPGLFLDVNVGKIIEGPAGGIRMILKNAKRPVPDNLEVGKTEVRTFIQVYFQYNW